MSNEATDNTIKVMFRPDDGDSDNEEISVQEQNKKIGTKQEYGDKGGFRPGNPYLLIVLNSKNEAIL